MGFGSRLREAREHLGIAQARFATLAKVEKATLHAIESRDSDRSNFMEQLISALPPNRVNIDYVRTGRGSLTVPSFVGAGMVREAFRDSGSIAPLVTSSSPREYASPSLEIPLMAAAGSMGDGNDQPDHDIVVRTISIEPAWVSKSFRSVKPDALRFITAYGESMAPTFHDGDVLLVDTLKTVIDIEGVYVLEAHRRLFIKRVRQRITDGAYEISSDNENAKTPDVLNGSHQVSVLGRVVWIWNGRKP